MKNFSLVLLILAIVVGCQKNTTQPQNSSTNNSTTNNSPCMDYGACWHGVYQYTLDASSQNWADTIMNNCKMTFTFIGFHFPPIPHPVQDSFRYKITANFDMSSLDTTRNPKLFYAPRGYNPYVNIRTKIGHVCLFKKIQ